LLKNMDRRVKPGNDVRGNGHRDIKPIVRHIIQHGPIPSPPDRLTHRGNRAAAPDVILASWCRKKVVPDKIRRRSGWSEIPAVRDGRIVEIKSPLILQPGPAALTDGLDAIVAALWAAPSSQGASAASPGG
jgi:hypothetical protein